MPEVEIVQGVPTSLVKSAADLYADALAQYFAVTRSTFQNRRALILDALRPQHAFAAIAGGARLVGVAGYRFDGNRFLAMSLRTLVRRLGWRAGILGGVLLASMDRKERSGQLLMDGIAVSEGSRGLGIGSRLLTATMEFARRRGLREVRLDVVNTNPRARRLYEREGFAESARVTVPAWLARRVGFERSATLIRPISRPIPEAGSGLANHQP